MNERRRGHLEQELRREVAAGHPLHGRPLKAVGKCIRCDELLFDIGNGEFAHVHLSYPKGGPDRPPWPRTRMLASQSKAAIRWNAEMSGKLFEEPKLVGMAFAAFKTRDVTLRKPARGGGLCLCFPPGPASKPNHRADITATGRLKQLG
jgi:hypothetical protein